MPKFNLPPRNEIGFIVQCADFQAISTLSEKRGGQRGSSEMISSPA